MVDRAGEAAPGRRAPGAVERFAVRRGVYADSVLLMLAAREAAVRPGVLDAAALLATPANRDLLGERGFELAGLRAAAENLLLAVRARDAQAADDGLAALERALSPPAPALGEAEAPPPRSFRAAARAHPGLNLALVSVPGAHAAYECAEALAAGLHVFCFSDGVELADEVALKRLALDAGLLMLGPECGTAILDGAALGFANVVAPGPVGIVGASGTGIQALMCLLDAAGVGISQAIGVGGRDLAAPVGGAMTLRALDLLAADPATEAIAVVGKAPDPAVAARVAAAATASGKPVALALAGAPPTPAAVPSLEAAAGRLVQAVGGAPLTLQSPPAPAARPGAIRGLFCGGTLCAEAASVIAAAVGSEALALGPFEGGRTAAPPGVHALVDFGAPALTAGRAHPMIDPSLRMAALEREAADDDVAVLLLDVVLGRLAHPDPAGGIAAALARGRARRTTPPAVVAVVCGSADDPQGLAAQIAALQETGVLVTRSSSRAARLALAAAGLEPGEP